MWLVIGTILKPLRFFCIKSAGYGTSVRFTYIEYHEGVVWNFSLTTIHLDLSRTYCASFFTVELLGVLISGFLINEYIFLRDFEITIATIGIVLISDKVL